MTYALNQFRWGRKSINQLKTIHVDLVEVVDLALKKYSTVDVRVLQGVRTVAEQKENIKKGVSKTMNSMHISRRPIRNPKFKEKIDNFILKDYYVGMAFDIAALVKGSSGRSKVSWDAIHYDCFAEAMRLAAIELGVSVTWGGCWTPINECPSIHKAKQDYIDRCKARKRKPFMDIGHFELTRKHYPSKVAEE